MQTRNVVRTEIESDDQRLIDSIKELQAFAEPDAQPIPWDRIRTLRTVHRKIRRNGSGYKRRVIRTRKTKTKKKKLKSKSKRKKRKCCRRKKVKRIKKRSKKKKCCKKKKKKRTSTTTTTTTTTTTAISSSSSTSSTSTTTSSTSTITTNSSTSTNTTTSSTSKSSSSSSGSWILWIQIFILKHLFKFLKYIFVEFLLKINYQFWFQIKVK